MTDPKSPPAPEPTPIKSEPTTDTTPTAQPTADTTPTTDTTSTTPDPQPAELKTIHSSPPPHDKPPTTSAPPSRESLLTHATQFLDSSLVRDAPTPQKQAFLESKGLTRAEAAAALAMVPSQPPPPIITYPEFLAPPPPPPVSRAGPLTAATVLRGLYFGAATAATVYGADRLVVAPMLQALTAARLEFLDSVARNLDGLTERLAGLAPASYVPGRRMVREEEEEEDAASSVSDPSELFHVDAATQTVDGGEEAVGEETPDGKLDTLTEQMRVLVEAHSDGTDSELTFLLEDLTSYLEGLTYDSGLGGGMFSNIAGYPMPGKEKDKDDPVQKFKQEIRSVKGVLLNSKNFPASRR